MSKPSASPFSHRDFIANSRAASSGIRTAMGNEDEEGLHDLEDVDITLVLSSSYFETFREFECEQNEIK